MNSASLSKTRNLSAQSVLIDSLLIAGFAVVTALASKIHIFLPFTPIPITFQTLPVILSGAFLGARRGILSQLLLIAFGCCGFSVFARSGPGYLSLIGPTAGYIYGFVLSSFISGLIFEKQKPRQFWILLFYFTVSSLVIFVPGLLWLKLYAHISWRIALVQGLYPFLIGDFLKIILATSAFSSWQKMRTDEPRHS